MTSPKGAPKNNFLGLITGTPGTCIISNDYMSSRVSPKSQKSNATQVVSKLFGTSCADNKETVTENWKSKVGRGSSVAVISTVRSRMYDLGRAIWVFPGY